MTAPGRSLRQPPNGYPLPQRGDALRVAAENGLLDSNGRLDGTQAKAMMLKNGIKTSVQLIGIYHDERAGGEGRLGLTFAFADAVAERPMNEGESSNAGGWEASDLSEWLSRDFEGQLPDDLRVVIESTAKRTNSVGPASGVSQVWQTVDRLWLPTVVEVVGDPHGCGVWAGE